MGFERFSSGADYRRRVRTGVGQTGGFRETLNSTDSANLSQKSRFLVLTKASSADIYANACPAFLLHRSIERVWVSQAKWRRGSPCLGVLTLARELVEARAKNSIERPTPNLT